MICRRRRDFFADAAGPLCGRVGNVFRRSADVPVQAASAHTFLLALMTDESYLHPLSILIEETLFARLEPGMPVVVDASGVRIGMSESAWGEYIINDINNDAPIAHGFAGECAIKLKKLLKIAGSRSKVGEAFLEERSTEFLEPVDTLRRALSRGPADLVLVERWFGGGDGLTPAWDDFCAGLLLCDRFFGSTLIAPAGDLVERLAGKTTIQSLWQLRFAGSGRSSLMIERFLAALARGILRTSDITRIAGIGHTSGNDILCGICLWLDTFAAASGRGTKNRS